MSKPALGRGLGDLMSKAATPKQLAVAEPQDADPIAGPGMTSLLKGKRENLFAEPEAEVAGTEKKSAPVKNKTLFPLWYLFAADVLLVLFSFLLIFKDPASLDWKQIGVACAAAFLGGVLAATGVLLAEKRDR